MDSILHDNLSEEENTELNVNNEVQDMFLDMMADPMKRAPQEEVNTKNEDEISVSSYVSSNKSSVRFVKPQENVENYSTEPNMMYSSDAELREKMFLLYKLKKYGALNTRFNENTPLEHLRFEVKRVKNENNVENFVDMGKQGLLFFSKGLEFLNNRMNDPLDLELEGWSETLQIQIDSGRSYDEVFEDIYELYSENIQVHPLVKLLLLVTTSAFMYSTGKHAMKKIQRHTETQQLEEEMIGPSLSLDEILNKIKKDKIIPQQQDEEDALSISSNKKPTKKKKTQKRKTDKELNLDLKIDNLEI